VNFPIVMIQIFVGADVTNMHNLVLPRFSSWQYIHTTVRSGKGLSGLVTSEGLPDLLSTKPKTSFAETGTHTGFHVDGSRIYLC
jgi:hypothetical protein